MSQMDNENQRNREQHFPAENLGSDYEYIRYIGSGSYGHVCKARNVKTGEIVAIKKFSNIFKNNTSILRLLREIRILRVLKDHPKIIKIISIIPPRNLTHFNDLYIVLEFMDTDLSKIISSEQYLSVLHIKFILYQILLATKCLHSARIYHRDLKPQNILINENCEVKICDFGLSRGAPKDTGSSEARKLTSHVVTRWYRAPEVIFLTDKYSSSIDIWSIGCIFAELLGMQKDTLSRSNSRMPLFPGISCFPLSPRKAVVTENSFFLDQISIILHVIGTPSEIDMEDFENCLAKDYLRNLPYWPGIDFRKKFPAASDLALDLLKNMLKFSPSKRLTVDEALSHPFLAEVREVKKEVDYPVVNFEFEGLPMKTQGRGIILREIMKQNENRIGIKNTLCNAFGQNRSSSSESKGPIAQNLSKSPKGKTNTEKKSPDTGKKSKASTKKDSLNSTLMFINNMKKEQREKKMKEKIEREAKGSKKAERRVTIDEGNNRKRTDLDKEEME